MAKRTYTKYPSNIVASDNTYGRFSNCSDEQLLDILGNAEQRVGFLSCQMKNDELYNNSAYKEAERDIEDARQAILDRLIRRRQNG